MLILVRHGQTAPNAAGLFLGRADPPLTDLGRRQATALRAALPRPGRVIASPLARARETAARFGPPVEVDERWIEMDYGVLDQQPIRSVADPVRQRWRAEVDFAPEGGESIAAVGRRVRRACEALAESASRMDVIVVSHVSPIKAAIAWALGTGDGVAWRMFVNDAAICRIGIGPEGPVLRSFNEPLPIPAGRTGRAARRRDRQAPPAAADARWVLRLTDSVSLARHLRRPMQGGY